MASPALGTVEPQSPVAVPEVPPPTTAGSSLLDTIESSLHARESEWLFLRELRVGTGRRNSGAQRLDAFALNCLPYQAMRRVCYEVKVSRADFLNEIRQPLKRRIGMRYSNEFYFVTPGGLLNVSEIPVDCGLIEVGNAPWDEWKRLIKRQAGFFSYEPGSGRFYMAVVPAPWRETPGPTWELAAAMLRNQRRSWQEAPPPPPKQQRLMLESSV